MPSRYLFVPVIKTKSALLSSRFLAFGLCVLSCSLVRCQPDSRRQSEDPIPKENLNTTDSHQNTGESHQKDLGMPAWENHKQDICNLVLSHYREKSGRNDHLTPKFSLKIQVSDPEKTGDLKCQ